MRLGIGVLGASRIAELAIVGPHESGYRLVAVAARDPLRAQALAEKHGVERVLTSDAGVIGDPEPTSCTTRWRTRFTRRGIWRPSPRASPCWTTRSWCR